MDDPDEKEVFYQRRLALIGKILTDLTEGIFDYLNYLQASKDRVFSILEEKEHRSGEEQKKFVDILAIIERHLLLLDRKSRCLNRFGQRFSKPLDSFGPEEVIEEAVLFSTRLAYKSNVSIGMEVDKKIPSLYCDSVYFHFLVSILIHVMVERMNADGKVIVDAGPTENGLLIEIKGKGPMKAMISPNPEAYDRLWSIGQQLVYNFGGRLQPKVVENDTKWIDLFVPLQE
jgi:hypothetical protein